METDVAHPLKSLRENHMAKLKYRQNVINKVFKAQNPLENIIIHKPIAHNTKNVNGIPIAFISIRPQGISGGIIGVLAGSLSFGFLPSNFFSISEMPANSPFPLILKRKAVFSSPFFINVTFL